ncbi:MAG: response regulator [Proteobacteria bacterium]|nr:response regulator [Pseudomonadota bacterium]
MKRLRIKARLLLVSTIPLIAVTLLMAAWFLGHRYYELQNHTKNEAHFIIQQLESASEYALLSHNNTLLENIASATLTKQEVISIAIFDQTQHLIIFQGPNNLRQEVINQMQWEKEDTTKNALIAPHIIAYSIPILTNIHDANNTAKSQSSQKLIGWLSISFNTSQNELEFVKLFMSTSLVIFIVLVIGILLARHFLFNINNILLKLKNGIHQMISGKFDAEINLGSSLSEINELQAGLNQLAFTLKNQEENFYQTLEENTHDLSRNLEILEINNAKLDQARKEALELSRMKTEFIANMAHEIRNPMNSIIGFSNLLLETPLNTIQREYLETIQKSARSLLFNINDILDFSKIESGKFQFDVIPTDIRDCIDEVLQSLAPNAQAKKIELISKIDLNVPSKILSDPLRLKQILSNLISNAIKFTPEGTVTVDVILKEKEGKNIILQISIIDTGIGVTPEEQKVLFNPFIQIANPVTHLNSGTGLGLVISKKLIEQMGGSISINSQPAQGSTFWFTINSEEIPTLDNSSTHYNELNKFKVLIYDENPVVASQLHQLCSDWKMLPTLSTDVAELKSTLSKNNHFDILLFGVNQFDSTNYELIQLFAEIKNLFKGLVITLVNNNQANTKNFLLAIGTTLCVSKPFARKKLYQDLVQLLSAQSNTTKKPIEELASLQSVRILVVEDNPANLMLMTVLIERIGALAITASDGREGVRLAKEHKFDLILLDLQMPNMNGLDATKIIRTEPGKNKNTPIIVVSAYLTEYDKSSLISAGVSDALIKPFDEKQLQILITKYVEQKKTKSAASKKTNGVIDWPLCLERASGKKELAEIFLKELLQELPKTRSDIEKTYHTKQFLTLVDVVHKLHGACCYTGVPFLKTAAAEFEKALKNKAPEAELESLMRVSLEEIDLVIEEGKKVAIQ